MTPANECKIDPAVVAALYGDHAPELRNFLIGVLRNRDAAEDVMQSAFMKAIEVGHTAREETLKGWLFRVAFHEALAWRRRNAMHDKATRQMAWQGASRSGRSDQDDGQRNYRQESYGQTSDGPRGDGNAGDAYADGGPLDGSQSPEKILIRQELLESVRSGLNTLPPEQQQVVRMRIYDEKTFAVIAEETGVPLGTVLTRMQLALQKLRRFMQRETPG